jgi:hypothetical protein
MHSPYIAMTDTIFASFWVLVSGRDGEECVAIFAFVYTAKATSVMM